MLHAGQGDPDSRFKHDQETRRAFTVAVMGMVLLSICPVLFGLWIAGTDLDISALMRITMVGGMMIQLAIFSSPSFSRTRPLTGRH